MCDYCNNNESLVLSNIESINMPNDALIEACSWRRICQVRGKNFSQVDPNTWSDICRKRGYLLYSRFNYRGY